MDPKLPDSVTTLAVTIALLTSAVLPAATTAGLPAADGEDPVDLPTGTDPVPADDPDGDAAPTVTEDGPDPDDPYDDLPLGECRVTVDPGGTVPAPDTQNNAICDTGQTMLDVVVETWNLAEETALLTEDIVTDAVFTTWDLAKKVIFDLWIGGVDAILELWTASTDAILDAWGATTDAILSAWGSATNALITAWDSATSATIRAWRALEDATIDAWRAAETAILQTWATVTDAVISGYRGVASAFGNPFGTVLDTVHPVIAPYVEQCSDGWRVAGSSCTYSPITYDNGDDDGGSSATAEQSGGAGEAPAVPTGGPGSGDVDMQPYGNAPACNDAEPIGVSVVKTDGSRYNACMTPRTETFPSDACEGNSAEGHIQRLTGPGGSVYVDFRIYAPPNTDKARMVVRPMNEPVFAVEIRAGDQAYEYQYVDGSGAATVHPECVVTTMSGVKIMSDEQNNGVQHHTDQKLLHDKPSPRRPTVISFDDTITLRVDQNAPPATGRYYVIPSVPDNNWKGIEMGRLHTADLEDGDGDDSEPYLPKTFKLEVGFDDDDGWVYAKAHTIVTPDNDNLPEDQTAGKPAVALHRVGTSEPLAFNPLRSHTELELYYESSDGDVYLGERNGRSSYIELPWAVDLTLTLDGQEVLFEDVPDIDHMTVKTGQYADCGSMYDVCVRGKLEDPGGGWTGTDIVIESFDAEISGIDAGWLRFQKGPDDDVYVSFPSPGAHLEIRDTLQIERAFAHNVKSLRLHPGGSFGCLTLLGTFGRPPINVENNLELAIDPNQDGDDSGSGGDADPDCGEGDGNDGDGAGEFTITASDLKSLEKRQGVDFEATWFDDGIGGSIDVEGKVEVIGMPTTVHLQGSKLLHLRLIRNYWDGDQTTDVAFREIRTTDGGSIFAEIRPKYHGGGCNPSSAVARAYRFEVDRREDSSAHDAKMTWDIPWCPDPRSSETLSTGESWTADMWYVEGNFHTGW